MVDPLWPLNGRAISNAAVIESRPLAVPDGAGGAIVNWQGFTVELNMYVQHVLASGIVDPAWPGAGKALSDADRPQTRARIVQDGSGGAILAWQDSITVVAQHVLGSGQLDASYPTSGRVLCNLPSIRGEPAMVATSGGGAIVSWTDQRGGDLSIVALQLLAPETTGSPGPVPSQITRLRASPNPFRGSVWLQFEITQPAALQLIIYDVTGRRVRELISGIQPAGEHNLSWDVRDDGGKSVGPGIYFAHLTVNGRSLSQRVLALK